MAGYTRQDTANNIANGNVIDADDFDAEYNAIEGAFNNTSGHTHDGTSGEGAPITKVGPAQDLIVSGTAVLPKTTNTLDLGSASVQYKSAYFDGLVNTDTLTVDETAIVTGAATLNSTLAVAGNTTVGGTLGVTGKATLSGGFDIYNGVSTVSSAEYIADTVGSMVSSNTESGISVTYDDTDNTLDFDVGDFTISLTGDVTGSGTVTNLGNVSFSTVVGDDSHNHTSAYITDFTSSARGTISVTDNGGDGSLTYNSGTGVISYTGPSATEVRAHITAGDGIDISSGVVSLEKASSVNLGGATFNTDNFAVSATGDVTVKDNGIILGTETTGNYVGSIAVTASTGLALTYTAGEGNTATLAGVDATTTVKGVASFSSDNFAVTSGAVSIKDNGITLGTETTGNYVESLVAGTGVTLTNNTGEGATPTIAIGQAVSTNSNVTFNDVVVSGDLTVSGTTTTVNTETVNIADNQIVLNSNYTGSSPTENGGIEIERGTLANKTLIWDEAVDKWTVGSETFVAGTFEGNLTGDVTGNASTATKLATARTIAGQSFDGSANISIAPGDLTGVTASASAINTASTHYVPSGGIIMWSGSVASIPSGWAICDGTNGTPNLTGRFVIHADADSSGTYNVGDTGGSNAVTLGTGDLPSHTHNVGNLAAAGGGDHSHNFNANTGNSGSHTHNGSTSNTGAHTHTTSLANPGGNTITTGLYHQTYSSSQGAYVSSSAGAHSHTFTTAADGDHSHNFNVNSGDSGNHTHSITGSSGATGSGTAHENRPPYYALAYIMKL